MKNKIYKLVILLLFLLIYFFFLVNHNIYIPCIFNKITHFYCPGCGVTRMIISLIKMNFYQAFRYNPLLFLSLPFILFFSIDVLCKWFKDKENYLYKKISEKTWISLLIMVIIYGILRNIPYFSYLKPTIIK